MWRPTYMYHPRPPRTERTHTQHDTRVTRHKPGIYITELYTVWIAQLVERSNVKQEARGSTPVSGLYFSARVIALTN